VRVTRKLGVDKDMGELSYPCIVAIGASAGGLAAFEQLIENLPTDTGMAFVLLSHILRGSKRYSLSLDANASYPSHES
jgi:two-component system CheB/CheR fusion protein